MISIPQNLKNEIEKTIKNIFCNKILKISGSFTDNLLNNYDYNKFTKNELNIENNLFNI